MTVYMIADIKVTDEDWIPEYGEKVHDIVHHHGGKYLSRSANITNIQGDPLDTTFIAIISFPAMDAFDAFANDPDYAPFGEARTAGSISRVNIIDDSDAANTIPYLSKT